MKILITGGTGFLGKALSKVLSEEGHNLLYWTRNKETVSRVFGPKAEAIEKLEELPDSTELDVVIHLAGAAVVGGRWTEKRKKIILDSRVKTAKTLVETLSRLQKKPQLLLSASGSGYYGYHESQEKKEGDPPQNDFLSQVCQAWEENVMAAEKIGIRTCTMRIGMILGKNGGAMEKMLPPFRLGLGGPFGSGKQWVSWIHLEDVIGLILHLIQKDDVKGPVNFTTPHPVTNKELSKALGKTLHRPAIFPVPGFVLKMALGEMAEVLLKGQKVLPQKALDSGYRFQYPHIEEALRAICEK